MKKQSPSTINTPASKAVGRPQGDHNQRRKAIAEATLQIIGKTGIEKASMRTIAREAGCTTGVLAHYFKNKGEILCCTLHYIFDLCDASFQQAMALPDGYSALQHVLLEGLPESGEYSALLSAWQCFISRAENDPALAEVIRIRHGKIRDHFAQLVARGQSDGTIRADIDAADWADILNANLEGLARQAPIETERLNHQRLEKLVELQLQMIAASK